MQDKLQKILEVLEIKHKVIQNVISIGSLKVKCDGNNYITLEYDKFVHTLVGSRDYMILSAAQMIVKYIVEPDKVLFLALNNFYAPV